MLTEPFVVGYGNGMEIWRQRTPDISAEPEDLEGGFDWEEAVVGLLEGRPVGFTKT
jgi:hypothetical protein